MTKKKAEKKNYAVTWCSNFDAESPEDAIAKFYEEVRTGDPQFHISVEQTGNAVEET